MPIRSEIYNSKFKNTNKVSIIIIIIVSMCNQMVTSEIIP